MCFSFLVLMGMFSVGWWYVYCWRLGLRYICHPLHLELRMPILINCPSVCLSFTSQTTTSYRLDCCNTYTHNAHRKPKAAHSTLRIEKCTVKTAHCICPKTINWRHPVTTWHCTGKKHSLIVVTISLARLNDQACWLFKVSICNVLCFCHFDNTFVILNTFLY